jgi:hypothetical protein
MGLASGVENAIPDLVRNFELKVGVVGDQA